MGKLFSSDNIILNVFIIVLLSLFFLSYNGKLFLNTGLSNLFNNFMFKLVVIFLIVYLSTKNLPLAIAILIVFGVTLNINKNNNISKMLNIEHFYGPPLSNCDNYTNVEGTGPSYPLNGTDDDLTMNNKK